MKLAIIIFSICFLVLVVGCTEPEANNNRTLLSVDFNQGQALRYKFISERTIDIQWDQSDDSPKSHKKTTESVNMVIKYEPVEVNAYGITRVKAYCESVKAAKSGAAKKDAVETLTGKSFEITVGPNGKIHDKSDLKRAIQEAGKKAFRQSSSRIKEPDLIEDFMASQWFLWDSISSIDKPAHGLVPGRQWKSKLLVPNSMVIRPARDVTYTLEKIQETEKGKIAVINSTYAIADSASSEWPFPWSGKFRLSGQFGFFRSMFKGMTVTSIEGHGREHFNLDAGRTENYEQSYKLVLKPNASPLPGTDPLITLDQRLSMQLLED